MSETEYCIACLTTGVKLFNLQDYSLGEIYSDLTKIPVRNWNQHLCFECASLIRKYQKFKLKCIRTDEILLKSVYSTGLTESALELMRKTFKVGSNLSYSEITIEDVTEIDSDIDKIKIENTTDDTCYSIDDGLFSSQNTEYSKENVISISDSIETHNNQSLHTKIIFERLEDTTNAQQNSDDKPNNIFGDLFVDVDFNGIDDQHQPRNNKTVFNKQKASSQRVIVACDDDSLQSDSSWTNTLNFDDKLSTQIPDTGKNLGEVLVPEGEINDCTDNESLDSNSSWTAILNSLSRIDTENKKYFTKLESDDYVKNFRENKNLRKVQKENNRIHFRNTIEHIKQAVKLITMIDKPKSNRVQRDNVLKTGKLTKSEYTAKLVKNLEKDGHTVQFLTKEQATNEVLNRAKSDNYTKSTYKCNLCYRGYKKEETFANHMLKHSPQRGPYICEYCQFRYPKKEFYTYHTYNMHTLKFSCKLCSFVCEQLGRASKHVRSHQGKTYDCKFCDKKFRVSNTLSYHIHLKHQDKYETQYICELCGNSFHSKSGFSAHKDKIHFNESNEKLGPACELCGIHFASQQAWDRHLVVSNKHIAENTISTASSQYEETHKTRKEVGPRKKKSLKYTCEFCGLKFAVEYWYKMHLHKYHDHPKPSKKPKAKGRLTCEICGEHFSVTLYFKEHLMKHTGERPYKCQYCGKSYRVKVMLNVHENTHTRAKIYKCDVCNMEFLLHASHSRHMKRMHMGLTPYKCLECDHSFVNQSELNAHIRHKHEKKPYPKKRTQSARNKTRTSIQLQTLEEEN